MGDGWTMMLNSSLKASATRTSTDPARSTQDDSISPLVSLRDALVIQLWIFFFRVRAGAAAESDAPSEADVTERRLAWRDLSDGSAYLPACSAALYPQQFL
jgi:hypothetical protein